MDEFVCVVTPNLTFRPVDVIVRCRDCCHAEPCPLADTQKLICRYLDEMLVSPDGFCAWGERRVE